MQPGATGSKDVPCVVPITSPEEKGKHLTSLLALLDPNKPSGKILQTNHLSTTISSQANPADSAHLAGNTRPYQLHIWKATHTSGEAATFHAGVDA